MGGGVGVASGVGSTMTVGGVSNVTTRAGAAVGTSTGARAPTIRPAAGCGSRAVESR